ncbi:putative nucleoredoxin [Trichinella spiralis]|uniref:protein-disulfide reductase n=1 Tax=Trichinella spiralis TaxID=6334 RepID=A0ABR3KE73_TRISP
MKRKTFHPLTELLKGKVLMKMVNGQPRKVEPLEHLKSKVVALYFSAHWCPPCRAFTPVLKDFYEEVGDDEFEIVFVSFDRAAEALTQYMNEMHGSWCYLPFGSPVIKQLSDQYDIHGVPVLVIIKPSGEVVKSNARADIMGQTVKPPKETFQGWKCNVMVVAVAFFNCYPVLIVTNFVNFLKHHLQKDGRKIGRENFDEALYFSAHWCPPCRSFTPVLKDFYEEVGDKDFEVIFVSFDRSEADLATYLNEAHGDWCYLPFGDPLIRELSELYNVQGIPALIVIKSSGEVVTNNGRSEVMGQTSIPPAE